MTANSNYDADITYGETLDNVNFSGVVEIFATIGGTTYGCTGSLLTDGYSILTAGHCVFSTAGLAAAASNVTVSFQGPNGNVVETISNINVDPAYSVGNSQNGSDLAVLTLSQQAPSFATEYSPYTGTATSVIGQDVVIAGYGESGTSGNSGATGSFGTLQAGVNMYEGSGLQFFGWSSQLLVGEFYEDGVASTDVLGCQNRFHHYVDSCVNTTPYSGENEVDISHGDSGGPSFYDGEIVGVHDLGICIEISNTNTNCAEPPATGSTDNSYFGEAFADTDVANNLAFIDGAEVPEPGTLPLSLGALGLLGFFAARRKRIARRRA